MRYHVLPENLEEEIQNLIKEGISKEILKFNQSMPDEKLTIRGEVGNFPEGIRLRYSHIKNL